MRGLLGPLSISVALNCSKAENNCSSSTATMYSGRENIGGESSTSRMVIKARAMADKEGSPLSIANMVTSIMLPRVSKSSSAIVDNSPV